MDSQSPTLLGFAAFSGTGKTELLTRLVPILVEQGLRIGMVKHAHHAFDVDQPERTVTGCARREPGKC